jgi:hypothetical protein
MWTKVKLFLGPYNRGEDYHLHLAHFIFEARCREIGVSPFMHFLQILPEFDWPICALRDDYSYGLMAVVSPVSPWFVSATR